MVTNGRQVRFVRFTADELWYTTEDGFEFPVPIADAGEASFLAQDKAMLFMRYIRKHLDLLAKTETVRFVRYKESELWYVTEDGFEFPVPVKSVNTALPAQGKATEFASYVQAHREMLEAARIAAAKS
jgi:hypothetical protein